MSKRKADSIDNTSETCPKCAPDVVPLDSRVEWIACEACRTWYHAKCLQLAPQNVVLYFCEACSARDRGATKLREDRPKRAKVGIDYTALDAGEHVNSLRHSYTGLIETHRFATSLAVELDGPALTKDYLAGTGFSHPIVVHDPIGLGMQIPPDLTVDIVAQLVGEETSIEVMDVPTQGEDKGWTLGKWAEYYNEPSPARVRNVISLEVSDTKLGSMIKRPRIVDDLDIVTCYWPKNNDYTAKRPKVQAYCLMSLQNSYTDFHVDFAGTSVYYHILKGSKTFLFIPPTNSNLHKYSDWCKSSNQGKTFLADQCRDTFKVELIAGDTMFIPSGWIHAVHTPQKSLVIGGNFLHLYGMQKHLEIADIEELTKVPGKFRFPYFTKTLWLTVFGILALRSHLDVYQVPGAFRLGQFLWEKLGSSEKPGRKAFDGIPAERLVGSPATLLRLFFDYVRFHADSCGVPLPNFEQQYHLTPEDRDGLIILIKTDLERNTYNKINTTTSTSQSDQKVAGATGFVETWMEVAISPEKDNSIYFGPSSSRRHYSDPLPSKQTEANTQDVATMIGPKSENVDAPLPGPAPTPKSGHLQTSIPVHQGETIPAVVQIPPPQTSLPNTSANSTTSNFDLACSNDNNYLPPLMTFSKVPTSPPRLARKTSNPSNDGPKAATTCFRCKTRKRRCDKERPCKSCVEVGLASSCSDSGMHVPMSTTSPSPMPMSMTPKVEVPQTAIAHESSPNNDSALNNSMAEQKSKRAKKVGARCGRCARDKKQCSREEPICDRCVKKNLQPSDCIYPHQSQHESNHQEDESLNTTFSSSTSRQVPNKSVAGTSTTDASFTANNHQLKASGEGQTIEQAKGTESTTDTTNPVTDSLSTNGKTLDNPSSDPSPVVPRNTVTSADSAEGRH